MLTRLKRWFRRSFRPCTYCKNEGVIIHYGAGRYATVRACPVCDDNRWIADTIIPTTSDTRAA